MNINMNGPSKVRAQVTTKCIYIDPIWVKKRAVAFAVSAMEFAFFSVGVRFARVLGEE